VAVQHAFVDPLPGRRGAWQRRRVPQSLSSSASSSRNDPRRAARPTSASRRSGGCASPPGRMHPPPPGQTREAGGRDMRPENRRLPRRQRRAHARRTISINDTDATRSAPPMSGQARWLPLRRLSATGAQAAAPRDNPAASAAALDERQAHPVVALCSPHRGPLPDRLGGRRRLGLLRGRRGSGGQ